ncbi:S26 family signal peptidase [Gammaproteobacteria bacterium SCGC AG-212-F23]|nr:S26 family signal peptidase [Gammaproteobacteria bacterium SCGC AG-212-F23]
MNFDFELILFYATLISGVLSLFDIVLLAPARKKAKVEKLPMLMDYARSFFPVLLTVFLLRSFLYEPFRIPTGSLKPTLLVGDFILVNKFDYGVRLPVVHTKIFNWKEPERGDIVVFRYPVDPSIDLIKRVIGLPGDHIDYINKVIYVNGKKVSQEFQKDVKDINEQGNLLDLVQKQENFFGIRHAIYQNPIDVSYDYHDIVVPSGMYFMMGDNRDDSLDSRFWGFVPEKNIVGKANFTWMSWNANDGWLHKIRWNRIAKSIY